MKYGLNLVQTKNVQIVSLNSLKLNANINVQMEHVFIGMPNAITLENAQMEVMRRIVHAIHLCTSNVTIITVYRHGDNVMALTIVTICRMRTTVRVVSGTINLGVRKVENVFRKVNNVTEKWIVEMDQMSQDAHIGKQGRL